MIIMSCVFMFVCLPVISLLYILVHNYYYCLQSKHNVNYVRYCNACSYIIIIIHNYGHV